MIKPADYQKGPFPFSRLVHGGQRLPMVLGIAYGWTGRKDFDVGTGKFDSGVYAPIPLNILYGLVWKLYLRLIQGVKPSAIEERINQARRAARREARDEINATLIETYERRGYRKGREHQLALMEVRLMALTRKGAGR